MTKEFSLNLSELRQIHNVIARLRTIISLVDALIKKGNPKHDLYSLREIGIYATGFTAMIEEIMAAKSQNDIKSSQFLPVLERAEIFCGIAERACKNGY